MFKHTNINFFKKNLNFQIRNALILVIQIFFYFLILNLFLFLNNNIIILEFLSIIELSFLKKIYFLDIESFFWKLLFLIFILSIIFLIIYFIGFFFFFKNLFFLN